MASIHRNKIHEDCVEKNSSLAECTSVVYIYDVWRQVQ